MGQKETLNQPNHPKQAKARPKTNQKNQLKPKRAIRSPTKQPKTSQNEPKGDLKRAKITQH